VESGIQQHAATHVHCQSSGKTFRTVLSMPVHSGLGPLAMERLCICCVAMEATRRRATALAACNTMVFLQSVRSIVARVFERRYSRGEFIRLLKRCAHNNDKTRRCCTLVYQDCYCLHCRFITIDSSYTHQVSC